MSPYHGVQMRCWFSIYVLVTASWQQIQIHRKLNIELSSTFGTFTGICPWPIDPFFLKWDKMVVEGGTKKGSVLALPQDSLRTCLWSPKTFFNLSTNSLTNPVGRYKPLSLVTNNLLLVASYQLVEKWALTCFRWLLGKGFRENLCSKNGRC